MPFEIVRNDITEMHVDAIVNTANPRAAIGSGTDAAIHAKAGPLLLATRKCIGRIAPGRAVMTPGFRLPAKWVIHTVGPVWQGGMAGEAELLKQCYVNSLALAKRRRLRSVALPLISAGNYGFPNELALQVACNAIREFLEKEEMQVYLVVFDRESYQLSAALTERIQSFIDENYVMERTAWEYDDAVFGSYDDAEMTMELPCEALPDEEPRYSRREIREVFPEPMAPEPVLPGATFSKAAASVSLEQMLKAQDAGFSETLLRLIDRAGKKDSEVYLRANISRQHFSKIRNNPNYQPTKSTALAFAIALKLDLEQTQDLIGRAGFALTTSSKADLIIAHFIMKKQYSIIDINAVLYKYDQIQLGACVPKENS